MAASYIQNSFIAGEISPSLYGRTDLAKWHNGASTMRNFFANYRGGAASRAGSAYVGMCKQPGSAAPPRDIGFQFNINQGYVLEFGDQYMRVKFQGAYVTEATKTITGITTASPAVLAITSHGYSTGDWIYISGVNGMTNFNGLTWIVASVPDSGHVTLTDLFGNVVNSTTFSAYTSGGTAARIYTAVAPYAAVDLPYLKYTQSADVMSLTCVNTPTLTEYAPYDLKRVSNTNWVFTAVTFATSITAPTGATATASASTTLSTYYSYVVTAVGADGEESIASSVATVENNDIAVFAGSNTITWSAVTGAISYNVYKATPSYGVTTPAGVLYGFMASALGTSATDSNIIADFTLVPPQHHDPFARGTPNPNTGTYPGVAAYYQQRRVYASTLNQPDTYFMSQPGAFLNFDYSDPINDGDSITGTPWAQQINGIQFMVPMPGGLVVLTGKGAWQLTGGAASAITPSNQTATPQAYNGCNDHVPPLLINYDILYVQSKGSIVRDLAYNFFTNIYTGTDLTVLSPHLFANHQIVQAAWAEEPYKLGWFTREDGVMLSLTYLKEQDVYSWARHDTNGLYIGVCSITEPPVDAVYHIVKRYIQGAWRYYSERMDNRNWSDVEASWCVDSGLRWPMTYPAATLSASAPTGTITFTASSAVFSAANVGQIIRIGGGKAKVTAYNSTTSVTATSLLDITATVPNDPTLRVIPAVAGTWSITPTTNVLTGLNHLEGQIVSILADGSVVPNMVVTNGRITLPQAYSSIVVGLPFICQLQTLYLDPPASAETVQGKRKNISSASVRCEATRGISVGTNQPDAAVQPNGATLPWTDMKEVKQRNALVNAGYAIPLFTGDFYENTSCEWGVKAQLAIQQIYPLPANVLACVITFNLGDS